MNFRKCKKVGGGGVFSSIRTNTQTTHIDKSCADANICVPKANANIAQNEHLTTVDAQDAKVNEKASINIKINKNEKYAQTTLTKLACDKCIDKGGVHMKHKIGTNIVAYKRTKSIKTATLGILMWLLAFVIALTSLVLVPNKATLRLNAVESTADTGGTATAFAGGNGTAESPYQIATPMQLRLLSEAASVCETSGEDITAYWGSATAPIYYEVIADITITSTTWTPIGSYDDETVAFYGDFYGNGHTITFDNQIALTSRASLSSGGYDYWIGGLFGHVNSSIIRYIDVKWSNGINSTIVDTNSTYDGVIVGGIVGSASDTKIYGCSNQGNITIDYTFYKNRNVTVSAGGIVGSFSETIIKNCSNTGNITISGTSTSNYASAYAAVSAHGIGGDMIYNSYNTGDISSTAKNGNSDTISNSAGIVASSWAGVVVNCYNTGSISAVAESDSTNSATFAYAGGIKSEYAAWIDDVVFNCFNLSSSITATAENAFVDGIVNVELGDDPYTNCYYSYPTSGTGYVANLASLVNQVDYFSSNDTLTWSAQYPWDFTYAWEIVGNNYPTLKSIDTINIPLTGAGSAIDAYKIADEDDLIWLSQNSKTWFLDIANFEVVNNIAVNTTEFTPIFQDESNAFYGSIDGNGYTITFNQPVTTGTLYGGLFGYANGATIQNASVNWAGGDGENTYGLISTGNYLGGILGFGSRVDIRDCTTSGSLYSESCSAIGGIAGGTDGFSDDYTQIEWCHNNASVVRKTSTSWFYAGGIVGNVSYTTISYCSNNGDVDFGGGIVGAFSGYNGNIIACYNTGTVNGGGILGQWCAYSNSEGIIFNCYNVGDTGSFNGITASWSQRSSSYVAHIDIINCFSIGSGIADSFEPYLTVTNSYSDTASETGILVPNLQNYVRATTSTSVNEVIKNLTEGFTASNDTQVTWLYGGYQQIWDVEPDINDGYPFLNSDIELDGDGTQSNPYLISNQDDFLQFMYACFYEVSNAKSAYYLQTQDINYTQNYWIPIGVTVFNMLGISLNYPDYMGIYDGNSHILKVTEKIDLSLSGADRLFFGGTIKNCNIEFIKGVDLYLYVDDYSTNYLGMLSNADNCNISGMVNFNMNYGGNYSGGEDNQFKFYGLGYEFTNSSFSGSMNYNIDLSETSGYPTDLYLYAIGCHAENSYVDGSIKVEITSTGNNHPSCAINFYGISSIANNCHRAGDISLIDEIGLENAISLFGVGQTVTNCFNLGNITVASLGRCNVIGVGQTVTNSYNAGTIIVENATSALVGGVANCAVNCYNLGNITATSAGECQVFGVGVLAVNSYNIGRIVAETTSSTGYVTVLGVGGSVFNSFNLAGSADNVPQAIGPYGAVLVAAAVGMGINLYYDYPASSDGMDLGDPTMTTGTQVQTLENFVRIYNSTTAQEVKNNLVNGFTAGSVQVQWGIPTEQLELVKGMLIEFGLSQETVDSLSLNAWDFTNVWEVVPGHNYGLPKIIGMSVPVDSAQAQISINNTSDSAVLVVISNSNGAVVFRLDAGVNKTYSYQVLPGSDYKVSIIGGTFASAPTGSGATIKQSGETYLINFAGAGSVSITI